MIIIYKGMLLHMARTFDSDWKMGWILSHCD